MEREEYRPGTTDRWTSSVHLGLGVDVRIADRTIRTELTFEESEREQLRGWTTQHFNGHPVTFPAFDTSDQQVSVLTVGLRIPVGSR